MDAQKYDVRVPMCVGACVCVWRRVYVCGGMCLCVWGRVYVCVGHVSVCGSL